MSETSAVPNPDLTLSEAINTMGVLHYVVQNSKAGTDPVLESVWEKLRAVAHVYAQEHPEEMEQVAQEIEMQSRFVTDE